jgi:hypothetical protein
LLLFIFNYFHGLCVIHRLRCYKLKLLIALQQLVKKSSFEGIFVCPIIFCSEAQTETSIVHEPQFVNSPISIFLHLLISILSSVKEMQCHESFKASNKQETLKKAMLKLLFFKQVSYWAFLAMSQYFYIRII